MSAKELALRNGPTLSDSQPSSTIECGEAAYQCFDFAPGYRNLNHGSFGTYPASMREVLQRYQHAAEAYTDKFIRYEYPVLLDKSRQALAQLLKVDIGEIVLVSNSTTGVNTVLRALEYQAGDVIIHFSTIYPSCQNTVSYITETTPAESRCIPSVYPLSDDALCEQFSAAIRSVQSEGKNAKLALFDTISSVPGVRVPFERLTDICRQYGVLSCIDAAHSVGQIELDLSQLQPDFFVSNCHKWLYVPRACAVFYVPLRNQALIRSTLPTSLGFVPKPSDHSKPANSPLPAGSNSSFVNNFGFVGTLDNSPYLCVTAALEWRKKLSWNGMVGDAAVRGYVQHIARAGARIIASALETEVMDNDTNTLTQCSMSNVRLPLSYERLTSDGGFATAMQIGQWMAKAIVQEYNTFLLIYPYDNAWWVRLSGQVYLVEEDFEFAAQCLKQVCDRVEDGEWRK